MRSELGRTAEAALQGNPVPPSLFESVSEFGDRR